MTKPTKAQPTPEQRDAFITRHNMQERRREEYIERAIKLDEVRGDRLRIADERKGKRLKRHHSARSWKKRDQRNRTDVRMSVQVDRNTGAWEISYWPFEGARERRLHTDADRRGLWAYAPTGRYDMRGNEIWAWRQIYSVNEFKLDGDFNLNWQKMYDYICNKKVREDEWLTDGENIY